MHNRPEYLEAMFAAWHAGLVVVPVNARLHRDEIAFILEDSGTSAVVTDPEHREDIDAPAIIVTGTQWERLVAADPAPLVDRRPDDPAWLFYTSGTTGRPKGATRGMAAGALEGVAALLERIPLRPRDVQVVAAPLFHAWGLSHLMLGFARCATTVVAPRFDAADTLRSIGSERARVIVAVPVMLRRILALDPQVLAAVDTSSLQVSPDSAQVG